MDKEFIKSEDYFSFELNGEESIDASELSQILRNTVEVVENLVPNQEDTYVNLIVGEIMNDSEHEFVNTIDTTLIIRKPDLVGRSKWGFIFDKNIEATIEDKEWLTKIHNEKTKFGMGMKLPVKLKIVVPLDNNSCPIGEPTYVVVKVTGDIQEIEDNQIALPV